MAQTVIGIFDYTNEAQAAVQYLENQGFARMNIDISARTDDSTITDDDNDSFGEGISNFFSNLFGNDNDDAKKYSEVGRRGAVVTVHVDSSDEADRAARILDEHGAIDVDDRAYQYSQTGQHTHAENVGGSSRDTSMGSTGGTALSGTGGASMGTGIDMTTKTSDVGRPVISDTDRTSDDVTNRSIPIIEENLEVGKRTVEGGTTRIRSRIVEHPVEETIRLRSERVNIERNPVNRPASSADISNFKEGSIEATERTEVPVVNKDTRVVEEISLNKEIDEDDQTIRDTVRKTEVDIDKTDSDEDLRRRGSQGYTTDNDRDANI